MKKILFLLMFLFYFSSCADVGEVKSGQIKYIPYTDNYAVGTDSTIVIINRESGMTINTISRSN